MKPFILLLFAAASLLAQSPGTYISIVSYGGVGDGVTDNTAFMQAGISAAAAGSGTLQFPCGVFVILTRVTVPADVTLMGQGGYNCSVIAGPVVYATAAAGGTGNRRGGARDIVFQGPGGSPPAGGSIGIYLGGDPAGTISASTAGANHQMFFDVTVTGWDTGIQLGNNAYNTVFIENYIANNNRGVYEPNGVTNSGSNMDFHDGILLNNFTCGVETDQGGGNFNYFGTQLEFNKAGICGTTVSSFFWGVHFENVSDSGCPTCGPFFNVNNMSSPWVKITMSGCSATLDSGVTTSTQMFLVSANRMTLSVDGLEVYSSAAVSEVFNLTVAQPFVTQILVNQVTGDEAGNIASVFNAGAPLQGLVFIAKPTSTQQSGQQCLGCITPDVGGAAITSYPAWADHNPLSAPPPVIKALESATLTSKRASVGTFGDWFHLQDVNSTGTRDYGLFNNRTSKLYQYLDPVTGHLCLGILCSSSYNNYALTLPPDSSNITQMMIQDGSSQGANCQIVFFNNSLGSSVFICKGSGVPGFSANVGSLFLRADGTTNQTLYINETGGPSGWAPVRSTANVNSVFTRTGAVVKAFGDYNLGDIANRSGVMSFSDLLGTVPASSVTGLAPVATSGTGGGITCPFGQHVNMVTIDMFGTLSATCN